jgi:hypothetical protein
VTEQQRRTIHKLLLYGPEYTNNPNYYSNAAWRNIAAALNILATATDTELSKAVSHALQLCLVAINRADTTASDVQIISAAMFHKLVQCIERQLSTQNLQACLRQARPIHKPCRSAAAVGTCTAAGPPSFRQINTALSMRQNERPQTTQ